MRHTKAPVKSVKETISVCLENNLTFAAYRLPNQTQPKLMVQKDIETEEVEALSDITGLRGFVIAPFLQSEKNRMFIIKPDFYFEGEISGEKFEELSRMNHSERNEEESSLPYEVSKEEYLEQIEKVTRSIKNNEVQKVVLSRAKVVNYDLGNQIQEIFSKLCKRFTNAFVYIFKAQGQLWMGATPEPFAFFENNIFRTSSVAGTKENVGKYELLENWGSKEIQEQQYVSDYISSVLNANHWENIKHRGPYVKKAGNLLHLRTDFTSNAGAMNGNLGNLIYNLHPTPAVCGFPKDKALEFIRSL